MAAEFLVKLYEYSPVFYICIISLCFIITAASVLGWFGFDVPVILRSSDEGESSSPVPERRMVQVTNPFSLDIDSASSSLTDGVGLRTFCLEDCELTCFWGCTVHALQTALHNHQHGSTLSTPRIFKEALHPHYLHCQTFHIQREMREECVTQLPGDLGVTDFGPLPRDRYPLVAVLSLTNAEHRDCYNIVSSVTVIHVPDVVYGISARVLFQYVLTAHGNMYDLKPLFMSAEHGEGSSSSSELRPPSKGVEEESEGAEPEEEVEEEEPGAPGRDCVVCQNAPVNRVLLPCRHTCVCDGCVRRFQHCPMCRAFVQESFALANHTPVDGVEE